MATPRQMTAHTLEALKGWPSQSAVDFRAKLDPAVTIDPVYAGRCVSLNDSGYFTPGIAAVSPAAKKIIMPMFVFSTSDDPDVENPGGITGSASDDPGGWQAISPVGYMVALVAAGSYELESTEYKTGETYTPNTALGATPSTTDATTGGQLLPVVPYTTAVVGICSRGVHANHHGKNTISFWPYVLPKSS